MVQGSAGKQGLALEDLRQDLAALPARWERLWALNLMAALLQLNPYALAEPSGPSPAEDAKHCAEVMLLTYSVMGHKASQPSICKTACYVASDCA